MGKDFFEVTLQGLTIHASKHRSYEAAFLTG